MAGAECPECERLDSNYLAFTDAVQSRPSKLTRAMLRNARLERATHRATHREVE